MTRNPAFIYPLIFALLIISNSCKKSNQTYPEVDIIESLTGNSYSFGDTIKITAKITNWDGKYRIGVSRNQVNVALPYQLVGSDGNLKTFEVYYNRSDLEGGEYDLRLIAYNGENSRSDFTDLYLNETPLKFLGVLLLEQASVGARLIRLDSALTAQSISVVGNQSYLEYNAFQGLALIAPTTDGKLSAFIWSPFQLSYEVENNVVSGSPLYNGLINSAQYVYSLGENGEIRAFGSSNSSERFFTLSENRVPVAGCYGDDGLALCVKERGKENYWLQVLNPVNGAVLKEKLLSARGEFVGITSKNTIVTLLSKNGQTIVAEYEPKQNELTTLHTFSGEPSSLLTLEDGRVLVSTTQTIQLFNIQSSNSPSQLFNFGASDMEYDKLTKSLLLASGNTLYRAGFTGSYSSEYVGSEVIQGIEMVYNK